jgi:PAS domain S-box-containing protein
VNDDLHPRFDSQVSRNAPGKPSPLYPLGPDQDESEENPWKLALESSGVGVWDWNLVTGDQTHSRRWKEMLGYAVDEIGQGYHEFSSRVHPDDLAAVQAAATAYLEGRAPSYAVDLRLRCKNGSWKWILTRGMVVGRDAQGTPWRMIGSHSDITERKQTEAELRELNRLLDATQTMARVGSWDADMANDTGYPFSSTKWKMLG